MTRIEELIEQRAKIVADARKAVDKAREEKRAMTTEENAAFDKAMADVDALKKEIDRLHRLDEAERSLDESRGRRTSPDTTTQVKTHATSTAEPPEIRTVEHRGATLRFARGTPDYERASPDYAEAFRRYLTTGEARGLQVANNVKGGYLAPVEFSTQLIKFLDDNVIMRQLANVLPPLGSAVSLGAPSLDTDLADADWSAEVPAADIAEDDAMRIGKRELTPHLLTKLVKMSMKLLRSSVLSVDALVRDRIGYKMSITQEKAFLTGTGAQQPLGVFVASTSGISTARDVTASATTSFNSDDIHNVFYNVKVAYQRSGSWLFHRDAIKMVRKFKDSTNQYLWQPSIQSGQPDLLLGRPALQSEYAPNTFTTGLYIGLFGDFRTGYWIADSLAMEIQALDQLFALRNQVGLLGRSETDGMPVLEEAFSRLKLA